MEGGVWGSLWGLGAETDQSQGLGAEATWEQLCVCGKASEAGRRAQKQIESAIKHKSGGRVSNTANSRIFLAHEG